ncbi:uncharacterized protein LOC119724293 [Patiria miniata]|uniref:TIR domain-containing protein n=1 Tax=Patiria miniata TaxID=46514 RepID=A0A913ZIK0_PATMI|nr:uncharacterized protein LOC119724293 [Patiria miniata]
MGSGSSNARSKSPPPVPRAIGQPAIRQPQITATRSPATGQSVTGKPANGKTSTGQPKTGKTATGQIAKGQTAPDSVPPAQPSQSASPSIRDVPANATGQLNKDSGGSEPATHGETSSDKPAQQLPPNETLDEPTDKPQATPAVDATPPEKDNSEIVSKCIKFMEVATRTGGQTIQCSPGDSAAFAQNTEPREALRSEFLKSLEQLRQTDTHTDDTSMESLLTVCNMSNITDPETADELVEKGYPALFVKIWKGVYHDDIYTSKALLRQYIVYNLLKQATISFTHVSRKLCAAMGSAEYGIVPLIAKEFQHPLMELSALNNMKSQALWDSSRETLKKAVNVLANIIRGDIDSKPVFREADVMPHLKALLECRFMIMRAKSLFCLVYLLNEDENEALNTTSSNIEFVIKILGKCLDEKSHYSRHYTFSAEVVVGGIVYLADNDANKVKLVKKGVTDLLIKMLKTDSVAEKRTAAQAVWKLAFHEDNKKLFKENTVLITVLKELHKNESDPKLLKACKTVLWMLDVIVENAESKSGGGNRPTTARSKARTTENSDKTSVGAPDKAEKNDHDNDKDMASSDGDDLDDLDDDMPHVMISYQWGVQQQMIRIKELLKAAGYNVWMDVDNMGGSTLESMAAAVEQSAVVLVCFTEKYKRSASCRTEAEYTYKLQKPIIPLRLQSDYDPDGWLGIMIGAKLYVDMSRPDNLEEDFSKLKQQLGERGRVAKEGLNNTLKSTLQDPLNTSGDQKGLATAQRGAPTRRNTNAKNPVNQDRHIDAKTVLTWTNDQVNAWLTKHGLAGLKNRFDGYSGQRLLGLKTISAEAPDFFYSELRKDLGFKSLLEIVSFKQALDEII